jgi:probable F420-dependent oxidoreductase
VKVSISMFGTALGAYAPVATRADELGFESLWIPEHLAIPLEYDANYPYQASGRPGFEPDAPFADPWVMFGHLSAVTRSLKFGVGVFVLPLRNPFVVAKAAATAQLLSGGRVMMGVGIGWMREEFAAVGETFERRGARMEEMITVMNKLWTGEAVEHQGEWYNFPKLQMSPGLPAGMSLPLVVGGASDAALKRAARIGSGWYGPPETLAEATESRRRIGVALADAGRDANTFSQWFRPSVPASAELLAQFREAGFERIVIALPRSLADTQARLDWLAQAAEWAGQR